MAAPPPAPPILNTYLSLLRTFSSFLTVAIHTILYERAIYPPSTFLSARAYNFPVRQSRHPKVCSWVNDAVAAVEAEMLKCKVARVAVVIYSPNAEVMERFMFDVSSFPVVEFEDRFTEFEPRDGEGRRELKGKGREGEEPVHVAEAPPFRIATLDVQEQLRATIRKLAYSASKLDPLPDDCTFTVTVELKPDAVPPVENNNQTWIPSPPPLQPPQPGVNSGPNIGRSLGGVKSVPVRSIETGEFVLESWIEEGSSKGKGKGKENDRRSEGD